MNAITPANEMPPDHSTAASGTLPTEQTKLSTAMSGPTSDVLDRLDRRAGRRSTKSVLKKSVGSRPTKPASRKPSAISFHSIRQSPRKLCATSDHASAERSRSRHDISAPAPWCW